MFEKETECLDNKKDHRSTYLLVLSQLESGSSSYMKVRQPSSLLYASKRVYQAIIKLDELFSCTKGYPDGWSGHAIPKLKSGKDSSSYLMGKSG